ncbi:hypothetical protein IGI04_030340 [Brassica rapa subsp. trilocularis]|uniref:Nucleotide-diphospho-sugar transferase domain-containing protein n=1 Tax=Brassica rapa subsp. trilocularis TaxID=1813537 RepID=A0ABQ7LTR7_BRACM|nr:hypothetical protein IGI04_030340 [Brassica rapa subsp. trilocularis]
MGVHILLIDAKASINVRHLNTFKYLFKKWSLYEQSGFDVVRSNMNFRFHTCDELMSLANTNTDHLPFPTLVADIHTLDNVSPLWSLSLLRRCVGYNSEDVMFLEDNRVSKTTSVQGYESDWLGRWTQPGNEVNYHDQSYNGDSNDLIRPEEKIPDEADALDECTWRQKETQFMKPLDFPVQEKTKQNLLVLMRPVRFYATVDSVQRVSDHQHRGGVRVQSLGISKY